MPNKLFEPTCEDPRGSTTALELVGKDASRIEAIIDELCVADGSRDYDMLTASHENETLEDTIDLAKQHIACAPAHGLGVHDDSDLVLTIHRRTLAGCHMRVCITANGTRFLVGFRSVSRTGR